MTNRNATLLQKAEESAQEIYQTQIKLQHQLDYDDLTGLYNLNKFIIEVGKLLEEHPDESYTILTFDVDNFKYITETYGFDASAKLIKEMGHTLRTNFKGDTPVARSGADIFLLLLDEKAWYY